MNLFETLLELKQLELPNEIYPDQYYSSSYTPNNNAYFFPIGEGIFERGKWKVQEHYPILVVGEDFGAIEKKNSRPKTPEPTNILGSSDTDLFWNKLLLLLGEESMRDCFFTHAIMGFRIGNGPTFAFSKGGSDFLQANQKFFLSQIDLLEPDVIIALGTNLPNFLAGCFPKQLSTFSTVKTEKDLLLVCPKGYVEIFHDNHPLRIVFIPTP